MAEPEKINIADINLFNKQVGKLKQDLFDAVHPIGEVYVQYPQQDDPNTLYNKDGVSCTWEAQTQYAGAFFRSEGGNAAAYIDKTNVLSIQRYQNAYHNHTMSHTHTMAHTHGMEHVHYWSGSASHSHNVYEGSVPMTAWWDVEAGCAGRRADGGVTANDSAYVVTDSKTISLEGWTSGSYNVYHSGRPNTDGASNSTTSEASNYNTSYNGDSSNQESRPSNYTVKIWKRIS